MVNQLMKNMQCRLQSLYELQIPFDVNQFLVTDPVLASHLDQSKKKRVVDEKLLIRQNGDDLDLTLFVDQKIVATLLENDPEEKLDDQNLGHYLTALEGVSHFLYLVWNAVYDRSISLFELELQAEVDKFVSSILLSQPQSGGVWLLDLFHQIFNNVSYDPALSEEERIRYESANHYAAQYCRKLVKFYLSAPRRVGVVNELRRFYRLTHKHKLEHIELMK